MGWRAPARSSWHTPPVPLRHHRVRVASRRRALGVIASAAVLPAAAACGGDGGGSDAGRFCADVRADVGSVVAPTLATPADLDVTLDHYRALGELAPPAIAEEWSALVLNLETAATVVPNDAASVQRAVTQAYATERSAVVVADWLRANCEVDLGPVATIVPHGIPTPATAPPGSDPSGTPGTITLTTEPAG
jgi:hypothetical protein